MSTLKVNLFVVKYNENNDLWPTTHRDNKKFLRVFIVFKP